MNTANLNSFKKIEFDVTKKLFNYIYNNINLNKVIEELDKEYSYFYDTENNLAFNIWLSLDYIHKDGKTFTEKFLEEKSHSLSKKEKTILEERKDSYVSIFEIIGSDKKYIRVRDILTEKEFSLLEPDLLTIVKKGEYVFSRIGKTLNHYNFIGDINYLPHSSKYTFMQDIIRDFNIMMLEHEGLTMKDYLKRFGLNLYKIYDDIMFYLTDSEDELSFYRLDEIDEFDEFENYLASKTDETETVSHLNNLSNIIESYLIDKDKTIEDLPYIDLNSFFTESIEEGLIGVVKELLSYIKTLKLYFQFLNKKDAKFIKQSEDISNISKNPFKYIQQLNSYEKNLIIDKNLSYYISNIFNYDALKLLTDFDVFLIYIEANLMELTLKKSLIKRKHLLEINNHLEGKSKIDSKAPNQKDFVNINFFYYLALQLELLAIDNNKLYFNKKAMDYLLLDDEDKYVVLFKYLSSEDFLLNVLNFKEDFSKREKDKFLNKLASMNPLKEYSYEYFSLEDKKLFFSYAKYLKLLDIIDYNESQADSIKVTSFGKKLSKYIIKNRDSSTKDNLINLSNYIK